MRRSDIGTDRSDGGREIAIVRRAALDVRDGINIFIFALADAFIRAGHRVTVVATWVGDPARLDELYGYHARPGLIAVHHERTGFGIEGLTPGWLTRGRRAIKALAPDLVLVNGALPFDPGGHSCMLSHDLGWGTERRRLESLRTLYKRRSARNSDDVVALSPEVGAALAEDLALPAGRVRMIPPCVDVDAHRPRALADREDAILHSGTGDYKDPDATVRAFTAIERPTTRLYIEGDVTDDLSARVAALPAATRDRIELVGALPAARLRGLMDRVRVAAFPTRYVVPTASATVVEAVASATPIIGSDRLSRIVLDPDANGIACQDDRQMTAAMDRLLSDDATWERMSLAAAAMAPAMRADTVAATYLALLDGSRR